MLKDSIVQIIDDNKERIKNSFKIDEEELNKIREFLNREHINFRSVIDDMSASNLTDRGKMTVCCIIGYVNGTMKTQLFIDKGDKIEKIVEKIKDWKR